MDETIAAIIPGVLIMVGAIVGGGAVYSGLVLVANAIKELNGNIPNKPEE